jgi:hypothetical protein
LCAAADADDVAFYSEAQGELEFLQRMGRFMEDAEHEPLRDGSSRDFSMDVSRTTEGQESSASATTTPKPQKPRRKSSSATQDSTKLPMPKILPLNLNPTKPRTATPVSLTRRDPHLYQTSDSLDDTSGDSTQASIKHTPSGTARASRTLVRKRSTSSVAFRFNEDGDIVTHASPPTSQPRTPTEEIIVPVLRKAHVKLDNRIIVEVGGQDFHVCSDIFEESAWFSKAIRRASFSGAAPRVRIENDPELFGEVLRYLRTGMFPLYWDRVNGFDYRRYAEMEMQAKMYQLPVLLQWIRDRRYLDVVTTEVVMKETRIRKGAEHYQRHVLLGNEEETVDSVIAGVEEVWMCPASIEAHEGDSTLCEVEGCCGDLLRASAKNHPEQRVKVDVVRVFTTQRKWTVNTHHLQPRKVSVV